MAMQDPFSGDLEKDWAWLRELWLSKPTLMQAEVGPKWEMPGQHRACIDFARRYPEAKEFLLGKLSDPLPLIAAYAFKCLVRITDLKSSDLPETVRTRKESITVRWHSHQHPQALAEYFSGYFESYEDRD